LLKIHSVLQCDLINGEIPLFNSRKSTVAILGIPIDNVSMREVMEMIEDQIAVGGFHQIATANVDFLTKSIRDEELHEILCRCDLVLPDGMPLVWASRWMGTALKERVPGADLVPELVALSAARGYRLFLLGAEEESSARAAAWMEKNYPGVRIVGRHSPKFGALDEMDHEDILRRIEVARPDILLVAFGNPKQEKWIAMHRQRLNVPICIGIGASLDFLSGKVSRAPEWMQASGMEWVYRLFQEPTRLAKRYLDNAICVVRYLTPQLAAAARQAKRASGGKLTAESSGNATVIRIEGGLSGDLQLLLEDEIRNAIFSGNHVVLDAEGVAYIGPDALGSLVRLVTLARRWRREIWLTCLPAFVVRMIDAARLRPQFRVAAKVTDALRRIEPEVLPETLSAKQDGAYCRIGGQLVPIDACEIQDLYYQMRVLMKSRRPVGQVRDGSVRVSTAATTSDVRLQERVISLDAFAKSKHLTEDLPLSS
jgi:N-acetylglucosaminyldiphosphoundecaprenol N-acetyl-beta-D-mannosaminyltransferase